MSKRKDILYISTLSSKRILDRIYNKYGLLFASAQKFHKMIVEGLIANGNNVQVLSSSPYPSLKPFCVREHSELEAGVCYKYIPFLNISGIKHVGVILYTFLYVIFWGLFRRKNKVIIFDVLNVSVCIGGLFASKLVGIKSVGIMTDMPGLMVSADIPKKRTKKGRFITSINLKYLSLFSSYVFLTEAMSEVINTKGRPYIVMEGLVDINLTDKCEVSSNKSNPRTLLYAGGLYARYGLKTLCESFIKIQQEDIRLVLFGKGSFVEELTNHYCKIDPRIVYKGVRPNSEVMDEELQATLLINPRPTHEEFTKYSFPSKNMEYMVSGTAVLTTKLPGMPKEYYPYVYLIEEETVEGYEKAIRNVLSLSKDDVINKGALAKRFVITQKNNVSQAKFIMSLFD